MDAEALSEARTFYELLHDTEIAETLRPGVNHTYAEAMITAADKLAARSARIFVPKVRIARLYAQAGANADALHWLEKAFEDREPPLVHLTVGWDWDKLRHEDRFKQILTGMNLPKVLEQSTGFCSAATSIPETL
jgi:hypothetical protein